MISNQNFLENLCESKPGLPTKPLNNQQHKDTTLTKIFVGGLPYHTTDESLRIFFESFGPIDEAVVITDRLSGKSKGYGFVTMANCEDAYRAISNPNPCIDGRKANVNLAILGARPRILPGVNLNSMALSRLVPIQSLFPQVPSFYNNMMISPMMTANLIGMQQQRMSPTLNMAGVRNSAPFANPIYNLSTSPTVPANMRNNYQYMPYSVNGDTSLLKQLPQNNSVTTITPSNSQIYLAATQQYMSALNFQQQLNSINPRTSSVGLLNNTDASADQINQSMQNYQIDPSFFV